jgi:hypothetical protein
MVPPYHTGSATNKDQKTRKTSPLGTEVMTELVLFISTVKV